MKVHIDVSVFTEALAIGMVAGALELPLVPGVGDTINFSFSTGSFVGQLRVAGRIIDAAGGNVSLSLEDVIVPSAIDGRELISLFEQHHGLHGDLWEE